MTICNSKPSIAEIKALAEQGDAEAQYKLGYVFFSDESEELAGENAEISMHWFRKAAMQGHPKGMWRVAGSYEGRDDEQAVILYRKSAEAGCSVAQWWLGVKYLNGYGIKQDKQQALHWLQKAAEQDEESACEKLGLLYERGECVEQDWQQSAYWYSKAAHNFGEKLRKYRNGEYPL